VHCVRFDPHQQYHVNYRFIFSFDSLADGRILSPQYLIEAASVLLTLGEWLHDSKTRTIKAN
jgi:hypothetical protein